MSDKIKSDIAELQSQITMINLETHGDELAIEQEKINLKFLSMQQIEEFVDNLIDLPDLNAQTATESISCWCD